MSSEFNSSRYTTIRRAVATERVVVTLNMMRALKASTHDDARKAWNVRNFELQYHKMKDCIKLYFWNINSGINPG